MSAQKIGKLLEGSLKRAGIHQKVTAARVIEEAKRAIQNRWGRKSLKKILPLYVQNEVLTIKVENAVYLAELKLKEDELIKEINENYKNAAVKKLRLLIK